MPVLMKKNLIFQSLILCLIGLSGCEKTNETGDGQRCRIEAKQGLDDDIVGTWKLVKGQTVFYEPKTIDYSCDNVIYEFQEGGALVISSNTSELIGLEAGNYTYELLNEPFLESEEFTLRLGGLTQGCEISTDAMTLNNAPIDGPILNLVRIR